MEILYILFVVLFLVSLATAGHRWFPDTQSCIRRDGYCKAKCTKIDSRDEVELGTCKNGRQKCCRPKRLLSSYTGILANLQP
ncbi:gallinacin-13-like [Chelonoidis abingdonii]|uniref:gallinacin-13-like n=1 Tax=Chelonoidis abingdonii TaxID=106734 RepID=UPI0013F268D9|nr:gallinacin-13-like [Chelonoidis abingdonii]